MDHGPLNHGSSQHGPGDYGFLDRQTPPADPSWIQLDPVRIPVRRLASGFTVDWTV